MSDLCKSHVGPSSCLKLAGSKTLNFLEGRDTSKLNNRMIWITSCIKQWALLRAEMYPSSHWGEPVCKPPFHPPQEYSQRPVKERPHREWIFLDVNIHKDDWGLKFSIVEPCTLHEKTKPQQRLALWVMYFQFRSHFWFPWGLNHDIFPWLIRTQELSATSSDQRWCEGLAPKHCQVLHPLHANCHIAQQFVDFAWKL